eukprot:7132882-Pyramimonas_sp.AAC.1
MPPAPLPVCGIAAGSPREPSCSSWGDSQTTRTRGQGYFLLCQHCQLSTRTPSLRDPQRRASMVHPIFYHNTHAFYPVHVLGQKAAHSSHNATV